MRYNYESYDRNGDRVDITTRFDDTPDFGKPLAGRNTYLSAIVVYDNLQPHKPHLIFSNEHKASYREGLERAAAWVDNKLKIRGGEEKEPSHWDPFEIFNQYHANTPAPITGGSSETTKDRAVDMVNKPPHYQNIIPGMQYMEMMQYMLKGYTGVEAHLMGLIYKYAMRDGKKDDQAQEAGKIKWYVDFLLAFRKNDKRPIRIEEIPKILK